MTTYILLRKNKESGPFSLEELKGAGVLPNDLFWVEGQSVCWQRPGELKELKDLVGQMPEKTHEDLSKYQPAEEITAGVETAMQQSKIERAEAKNPAGKKPEEPETRYSKPLEEIKEIYLKNLEEQQKRKRFTLQLPAPVKRFAPYAVFLLIGIITGVLINKGTGKKKILASGQLPAHKPVLPEPVTIPEKQTAPLIQPAGDSSDKASEVTAEPPAGPVEKPAAGAIHTTAAKKIKPAEPAADNSTHLAKQDERPARSRDPETNPVPVRAEDISPFVSVKTNDYVVGSFGGIRNLQLTVQNDSKYTLDKVTVELQYLKPMDELLRTENIQFHSVPPRGAQTLPVPKSNRGVKVTCRVIRIESKEADPGTAGL